MVSSGARGDECRCSKVERGSLAYKWHGWEVFPSLYK